VARGPGLWGAALGTLEAVMGELEAVAGLAGGAAEQPSWSHSLLCGGYVYPVSSAAGHTSTGA